MTEVLPPPADSREAGGPAAPSARPHGRLRRRWPRPSTGTVLGLAVAVASALFVLSQLHPRLLVSDTTPAGGDMGAHVWGPAYLRDHLLPSGRVTGWTPDWYAGFPAYHFYMVVPSLAIVALDVGFTPVLGVVLAAAVLWAVERATRARPTARPWALAAAAVLGTALVGLPYGVAFKLVTVTGVVLMPVAAWAMGRLFRAPEPVPALLALGTLPFLFDTNFSIYGGNVASTLAGEFAFSISLALGLLAIGLVGRGLDSGRYRAVAAVVIALTGLCHLIPLFFVVVACIVLVALSASLGRAWWLVVGASAALAPVGQAAGAGAGLRWATLAPLVVVAALLLAASPDTRRRAGWLVAVGGTAVLLAAFWMVPFVLREPFMNDMGWERLLEVGDAMLTTPMRVALPVAAIGFALAVALRDRLGVLLGILALVAASATANVPDTRLWNARLLPFFYLSVYLLAAVGVGHVARLAAVAVSERFDRPDRRVLAAAPLVALAATVVAVGMPLRALPGGESRDDGSYHWLGLSSGTASFIPSWAAWNYAGYEEKPSYREYHGIVSTMADLGVERGCGRAMWEYSPDLDRYGTPMALMLLPHWTDGCIGSMEGLYFESSATTPFHFLNQSVLSEQPSRAQRDLPYRDFDAGAGFDLGVQQLQTFGVRYYLASSDAAIAAARSHPELAEVATSGPWAVFEVDGADLVEALEVAPVVVEGPSIASAVHGDRFRTGWLGEAVASFNTLADGPAPLPAESGPDGWPRAQQLATAPANGLDAVDVSDVEASRDRISFRVDRTGVPVLVKASYFPNWEASGADGPWRVGPNLMAVVPTDREVTLQYSSTVVDRLGWVLTLLGVAATAALVVADQGRRRRAARPAPVEDIEPERVAAPDRTGP